MQVSRIEKLIRILSKLPGLGPRSARRAVLHLMKRRESLMVPLADAMLDAARNVVSCSACGNLDTDDPCSVCTDPRRDASLICVVEEVADLWALQRSVSFKGLYHVLGGVLSALDGVSPDDLRIPALVSRVREGSVKEVILATNVTVDGQTTAHYIADLLSDLPVSVTVLAHGVPMGGELDYMDDGTLDTALKARRKL
jgi:recombination protein RecR